MGTYTLFGVNGNGNTGPSSPVGGAGSLISGLSFFITGSVWFEGYWQWVCSGGSQNTSGIKCALWQRDDSGGVHLVPNSTVTSGTLTKGQWNYIPLATPIAISTGGSFSAGCTSFGNAVYIAAVSTGSPFPDTANQWGSGNPFAGGLTNGPLSAFSGLNGSLASGGSYNIGQPIFDGSDSDPSLHCPVTEIGTHDNLWIDVQVTDVAPVGTTSYRTWPGFPALVSTCNADTTTTTSGHEFWLSQACQLKKIWFYSPATAVHLPQRCGIWSIASGLIVAGTDNASPSWSGAAASGWVYVDYSGSNIILPGGKYRVATWSSTASVYYYDEENYWNSAGPGKNNIVWGPLTMPNAANASNANWDDSSGSKPAQGVYQNGAWAFPNTGETKAGVLTAENRGQDVEVTPVTVSGTPGMLMASII